MIWLTWKLLTLPFRVVFGTIGFSFRTIRFVGLGRILAFGAGVGTGLAIAPTTGTELRARLAEQYGNGVAPSGGDLGEAVRHELAHSPRTWHLPQPTVSVVGNRVTLTGQVPHDTGRADLARAAGAVSGVGAVDNRITVPDDSGATSGGAGS